LTLKAFPEFLGLPCTFKGQNRTFLDFSTGDLLELFGTYRAYRLFWDLHNFPELLGVFWII
jgi:hypothetical protein